MQELVKWARVVKNKHPEFISEINDLMWLCVDEIEAGGSETSEIENCKEAIRQLTGYADN